MGSKQSHSTVRAGSEWGPSAVRAASEWSDSGDTAGVRGITGITLKSSFINPSHGGCVLVLGLRLTLNHSLLPTAGG